MIIDEPVPEGADQEVREITYAIMQLEQRLRAVKDKLPKGPARVAVTGANLFLIQAASDLHRVIRSLQPAGA